ncbi:MAG: hypothetical protein JSR18_11825 [Proteobacteria bacterium]|nr:hypothetical protein [Pseudomonadota bacterium]
MPGSRIPAWVATLVAAVALVDATWAQAPGPPLMAVPPATNRATAVPQAAIRQVLGADAPAVRVVLAAPTAAQLATLQARTAAEKRTAIGIPRDVGDAGRALDATNLPWQALPDGRHAARFVVSSAGAAALRVALRLASPPAGATLTAVGDAADATVRGPVPLATIARLTASDGEWWSPVLNGATATFEIVLPTGATTDGMTLSLVRISHLVVASGDKAAKALNPGESGACELDARCEAMTPAYENAMKAVGQMTFTASDGVTYNCTGTLINDSLGSNTPYFFSARHCLDSARAAHTLSVVWFYYNQGCHSDFFGPYAQQDGGAELLANSNAEDWALVKLAAPPSPGTVFAAWDATPVTSGAIIDLHHPRADIMKFSAGTIVPGPDGGYVDYVQTDDVTHLQIVNSPLVQVVWDRGITEGGSSGSGLLTYDKAGDYYAIRGGLFGGGSACDTPKDPDFFSRFDRMLPLTRQYLTPDSTVGGLVAVTEYHNVDLDQYFMTASPQEVEVLDDDVIAGWDRTGLRFLAYANPAYGRNPVCRFYRTPPYPAAHFYSADPADCQALIDHPDLFPGWQLENAAAFYIALPNTTTGRCPANTRPVYRFFHAATTNHRYTTDIVVRNNLLMTDGWYAEGYGPDKVAMCAPNGG